MTISFSLARKAPARADLHAIGVTSDQIDDQPHGLDWEVLRAQGFEAKLEQVAIVSGGAGVGRPVAVVGLGPADELDSAGVRRAAAALARSARQSKRMSADVLDALPEGLPRDRGAQAFAEGVALGAYDFAEYRSEANGSELAAVTVVGTGGKKVAGALDQGARIAESVNLARDLVNRSGGDLTPAKFARAAVSMAKREGLRVKVLDRAAIKKARLGGLLGVNRGSTQEPRLVEITHVPAGRPRGRVALVGKGITFDAGGLSIKTGQGMMTMKCDMGGAAAVVGAMSAVKSVAPGLRVTAYLPMTDNMLGGDATRPGDVLTIRNGKTVEVLNTDAEGRLILADALSLAAEAKPDAIVDLATLTGACMVALGRDYAGVMGTHHGWVDQVLAAGAASGEKVWHLPLPPEYRPLLDSDVADVKNIGGPHGGALTAGLFLQEFVPDGTPWAHIDIAGPAFSDKVSGEHPKGGTGYGVRLLLELLAGFTKPE